MDRQRRNVTIPNRDASNEEKESKSYGLEYAQYIEFEWITGNDYTSRKKKFEELEALRNNEVDIDRFKNMLNIPKDQAYLSLNWEFTSVVPKFVNVVKDSFPADMFKIKTKGVDIMSREERNKYRKRLETEMLTKDFTQEMTIATGINFVPDYVPDSKEELDLHMQLEYRQKKEIASEIIINRVFDLNYFREIQNRVAEDLVTNGIAAIRVESDPNYGVVMRRVDCKNLLYSYDPLYTRDKKGCYYFAEMMEMTAGQIVRMSGGEVSYQALARGVSDKRFKPDEVANEDDLFTVMYFTFKTTMDEVYKRKRNNLIPKDKDYVLPKESSSRMIKGKYDVWFEGYYVLGMNLVFNYHLMRDMIRPVNNANTVMAPYIIYELTVPSIVENLKSYAEDIHLIVLKLRHLISKMKPDMFEINVDALMNIDIGTGAKLTPSDVLDMMYQTGALLYKGTAYDDDQILQGNILRNIPTADGQKLMQLINAYNQNMNMCYEVTGVNRVRDGSAPLNGALVGTQQMALNMSNTATKHIFEGLMSIKKGTGEVSLNRAQQMSMYKESFSDDVMSYLLEDDVIDDYKTLYKYNLDVIVEVAPDAEEKAKLDQVILAAVQAGQITLADRMDILSIDNIKMASKYLKVIMKKRQDEAFQKQKEMEAMKTQMQAQAQVAIEQQKQQSLMMEIQAKGQELQFKTQSEIQINEKKVEGEIILERVKHQLRMQELGLQARVTAESNQYKEQAKDARTYKQAQQQSAMINQRQRGGATIPFESMNAMQDVQAAPPVEIPPMEEVNQTQNYTGDGTTEEGQVGTI